MFGFDLDYGDRIFDDGWFHVTRFRPIVHLMSYWGIFPFRMRFTDLRGVMWSFPLTGYSSRWSSDHYFYDDFLVEPLGSHPVRHAFLSTQMPSSCFLPKDTSLISGYDSVMDSNDQDYISVDAWFDVIWFSLLVTHLMPYWGIFPSLIEIRRSLLVCVIIPSYEIHIGLMILFHFVMTLRRTFPWVVSSCL